MANPIDLLQEVQQYITPPQTTAGLGTYLQRVDEYLRQKVGQSAKYKREALAPYLETFKDVQAPTPPRLTELYLGLREKLGLAEMEDELVNLRDQLRRYMTYTQSRIEREMQEPIAAGVIEGRIGTIERQARQQARFIEDQIQAYNDTLKTAYSVLENIVQTARLDWNNAYRVYSDELDRAYRIIKTVEDDAFSREKFNIDLARANLQTIINLKQQGLIDFDTMKPEQRLHIEKLERMAGLPVGFVKNIALEPNARIVQMVTRTDPSGKQFLDIVLRNPDGSFATKRVYLGRVRLTGGGGGGSTLTSRLLSDNKYNQAFLAGLVSDLLGTELQQRGTITPETYKRAYNLLNTAIVNNGGDPITPEEFHALIAKTSIGASIQSAIRNNLGSYLITGSEEERKALMRAFSIQNMTQATQSTTQPIYTQPPQRASIISRVRSSLLFTPEERQVLRRAGISLSAAGVPGLIGYGLSEAVKRYSGTVKKQVSSLWKKIKGFFK